MDSLENLLKDLLGYAEEGLSIDETMARRIKHFLEMEKSLILKQEQALSGKAKEKITSYDNRGGIVPKKSQQ